MIFFKRKARRQKYEVEPDEIFLDARNIPQFDTQQFEGRLERPISKRVVIFSGLFFVCLLLACVSRLLFLQVAHGEEYAIRSQENSLERIPIFAERGIIFDRNGVELVKNIKKEITDDFSVRIYPNVEGFSHVLGYVGYPIKDNSGVYWQDRMWGRAGVEKQFDADLSGHNGAEIIETSVHGTTESENIIDRPVNGKNITLSIDSQVQKDLYQALKTFTQQLGFEGGAGIIMDVHTGEIIALTSFPEYSSAVLSLGDDRAKIKEYLSSPEKPFLNRAFGGLYTPGSIVKPYVALGALNENVIDPYKKILSTGSISIPNPYDPKLETIFKDNKAHGWVDMRDALAVSSNVYFYEIGGGFQDQKGLGIANIEKYTELFGLGHKTGINLPGELDGTVPSPEWKHSHFPNDPWRVGDTYNTAIGQYGFQVTPLEMVRAVAAIANHGDLLVPSILKQDTGVIVSHIDSIPESDFQVVREGMRQVVTDGTGTILNIPQVAIAAKTGTAQVGSNNQFMNSWSTGFFPYENPKYAFAILEEHGPKANTTGASHAMRTLLDAMVASGSTYIQ